MEKQEAEIQKQEAEFEKERAAHKVINQDSNLFEIEYMYFVLMVTLILMWKNIHVMDNVVQHFDIHFWVWLSWFMNINIWYNSFSV